MRIRDALIAAAATGVVCLGLAAPALERLELLSIDLLHWLRHQTTAAEPPSDTVAILALDEETYRTPPFADTPQVVWTPQLAQVLGALTAAGAKVVGFDVIFPTSIEKHAPGFDRDFLLALRAAARDGKVVLGKAQHSVKPIAPHAAQSFAVGHDRNIRALNLTEDADGVIRRMPLWFTADAAGGTRREPSLAAEVAARAAGRAPDAAGRDAITINYATRADAFPAFSLADIHACIAAGKTEFLARHFAGRAVLVGSILDVEDRKLTSARMVGFRDPLASTPRCALPASNQIAVLGARDSIPGVIILANAVSNLIRGDALRELSPTTDALLALPLVAAAALLTLLLPPLLAATVVAIASLVWTAIATYAFNQALVLPLLDPIVGAAAAYVLLLGYRFMVADRDKRFLRATFGLYLAPAIIERMAKRNEHPRLGGETRELTVFFSDLAKFSAISEGLTPQALVTFMNQYLSAMTDVIEAHGGFVDKYIGDAIVAVFGAPQDDPEHATNAVRAALACAAELERRQGSFALPPGAKVAARIGLNTGPMLVGNIGSHRRFNYTVMGDAVNLASRLEGANKQYGTGIIVSAETMRACGKLVAFRELDRIRVVGREGGVAIYEPLGMAAELPPEQRAIAAQYEAALASYRARQFIAAAAAFAALAETGDQPADVMAARAMMLAEAPPKPGWDGTTSLDSK